jgi:serine/threonine protein kinase
MNTLRTSTSTCFFFISLLLLNAAVDDIALAGAVSAEDFETSLKAADLENRSSAYVHVDKLVHRDDKTVFRARAFFGPARGKQVVVKRVDSENEAYDPEVAALNALKHVPGIVKVLDSFYESSSWWIVQEWCPWGNLRSYYVPKDASDEKTVAEIENRARHVFGQIAGAVAAMHDEGLAHRDLTPSNIFIAKNGPSGLEIKIGDLGLAVKGAQFQRFLDQEREDWSYYAPEQFYPREDTRKDPTFFQGDVYALGMLLYYLLTGEHAYQKTSDEGFELIKQDQLKTLLDKKLPKRISFQARNLLRETLVYTNWKRISSQEILNHPWLKSAIKPAPAPSWNKHLMLGLGLAATAAIYLSYPQQHAAP